MADKRLPDRNTSVCFERTAVAPEAQLSNFPEEDEAGVKYFRGIWPSFQVQATCSTRQCMLSSKVSKYRIAGAHPQLLNHSGDISECHTRQEELQRNDTLWWPDFPRTVFPLSACTNVCSRRGGCVLFNPHNKPDRKPACECYYGWQVRTPAAGWSSITCGGAACLMYSIQRASSDEQTLCNARGSDLQADTLWHCRARTARSHGRARTWDSTSA